MKKFHNGKRIEKIVDVPKLFINDGELAGDALLNWYKSLGWNSNTHILNPNNIRTTQDIYNNIVDFMADIAGEYSAGIGMLMVSNGPGVDDDVPQGKVILLDGWVTPDETQ